MKTPNSKSNMLWKKLAIIPLMGGLVFLFADRVEAQTTKKKPKVIEIPSKGKQATEAQMDEYRKFEKALSESKKGKFIKVKEVKRLKEIYSLMSDKQKKTVQHYDDFLPPPPPPPQKIMVKEKFKKKSPSPPKPPKKQDQIMITLSNGKLVQVDRKVYAKKGLKFIESHPSTYHRVLGEDGEWLEIEEVEEVVEQEERQELTEFTQQMKEITEQLKNEFEEREEITVQEYKKQYQKLIEVQEKYGKNLKERKVRKEKQKRLEEIREKRRLKKQEIEEKRNKILKERQAKVKDRRDLIEQKKAEIEKKNKWKTKFIKLGDSKKEELIIEEKEAQEKKSTSGWELLEKPSAFSSESKEEKPGYDRVIPFTWDNFEEVTHDPSKFKSVIRLKGLQGIPKDNISYYVDGKKVTKKRADKWMYKKADKIKTIDVIKDDDENTASIKMMTK